MRDRIAQGFLRLAFSGFRSRRLYEPVEIGGRRLPAKRDSEERWNAIAGAIRQYGAGSVLDVGCAEGWFLRRAATELNCFGLGVEASDRRLKTGEIARLHDGVERVAVMKARLSASDIRRLPRCDLVLCLSVVHHVLRHEGLDAAEDFVRALLERTGKALIFEMGTSDEKGMSWAEILPPMPDGQEVFLRSFLGRAGAARSRVIANTPGLHGHASRLLFAVEPTSGDA